MRIWILATWMVGALAACGACKSSDDEDEEHRIARSIDPIKADDDTCDPATPKVCVGPDVVVCEPTGHLGRRLRACHDGCAAGHCARSCDDDTLKVIYAVDDSQDFLKFDPSKLPGDPFTVIGKLACEEYGSPFSMAVDRNGFAWVLYQSGNIYKVSVDDATCQNTAYTSGGVGARTFGMGFVTDTPGGSSEHLYLTTNAYPYHNLVQMEPDKNMAWKTVGPLEVGGDDQSPELTGTNEARMFGFYPVDYGVSYVQEIDKSTGNALGKKLTLGSKSLGDISAYAFAQWGGKFYVFATSDGWNNVHAVDRTSGSFDTVRPHTPYKITGAGVSTCAPEKDQGAKGP